MDISNILKLFSCSRKAAGISMALFGILLLASCSNTKYLPKGETLYVGSKIEYKSNDSSAKAEKAVLKDELKALILPKPNGKILGLRVKLWLYNIAGTPKGKGLRYFIRKLGEPPVLAKDVNFEKNRELLANRLQNRGYFKSQVSFDTTTKDQRTSAVFTTRPGVQYLIDTVNFPTDSSVISKAIRAVTSRRSQLRRGRAYDLDVIKAERTRIDARLKQRGYFFFSENDLIIKVDSNFRNNKVNMYVQVKPETPRQARLPYRINDVIIFADYNLDSDTSFAKSKAVFYDSFYVVDPYKKFHPRMFKRNVRFHPGDLYNRNDHNLTLSRLVNLGVYKFVKARFEAVDTTNVQLLNAYYFLSPNNRYSAKAQVSALTKSNNTSGSDLTVSVKDRNAFRSAEQLSLSGFFGLETQIAGNQNVGTTRFGGDIDLVIPRIIGPVKFGRNSDFVPKTKMNLGYEYFRRTDQYTLNSLRSSFGWIWNTSITTEHQYRPINVVYVVPTDVTPQYQDSIKENITLKRAIERQFIIGTTYNYNFNSLSKPNNKRHNFFFNGNADVSGNLVGLITGADLEEGKQKEIFNTPFSQYIRGEADFRHYLAIGRPRRRAQINMLASRIIMGAGYAYGNSNTMPFIKQFFVGGTNSLRAYRARSLGPGTYYGGNAATLPDSAILADQPGDIKMEINTELRFNIASIVRGALFIDAGNVFTMREDSTRPGSKITKDFYKNF